MQDVPVTIEAVAIAGGKRMCKGRARTCLGQKSTLHILTPEGVCARAFAVLYPYALAMRFAEKISFERKGPFMEILCPDGDVTFRLSRADTN